MELDQKKGSFGPQRCRHVTITLGWESPGPHTSQWRAKLQLLFQLLSWAPANVLTVLFLYDLHKLQINITSIHQQGDHVLKLKSSAVEWPMNCDPQKRDWCGCQSHRLSSCLFLVVLFLLSSNIMTNKTLFTLEMSSFECFCTLGTRKHFPEDCVDVVIYSVRVDLLYAKPTGLLEEKVLNALPEQTYSQLTNHLQYVQPN